MKQNENNSDVHSFDDVMDAMLGAPGTPQRDEFRREAFAYCDARKANGTKEGAAERCYSQSDRDIIFRQSCFQHRLTD